MTGTLFLVVGPSGGGKDTLIAGARERLFGDPDFVFPRRLITRPSEAGGEDHEEVSEAGFEELRAAGGLLLHWRAHGLRYGIPGTHRQDLEAGRNVVVNVSRTVVAEAMDRHGAVVVIEVTAPPDVLAGRLARRGRETRPGIDRRLARETGRLPEAARRHTIENTGPRDEGVERIVAILRSERDPPSLLLRRKTEGAELTQAQYRSVIADIADGRFSEREITDFVVAVTETLTRDETTALARVRAEFKPRLQWDADIVADKHSLGGIPGNRISMIVIPIVAAHGLTIPKTSSRAITSPAGTADTMEVLARVDLDADDARRVVRQANGCLISNSRLKYSRLDDVMYAVTRPLRLDSLRWSVASILSQKLAAGATHCVIDIPVGPAAKVRDRRTADELSDLFLHVGRALRLELGNHVTDGSRPVGRGIGPALEARDVVSVLQNRDGAPADLRDKALTFAASALAFDPSTDIDAARARARDLLASGAAWETFERIAAAQGPPPEAVPDAPHAVEVLAGDGGVVTGMDCYRLSGIARAAGAPADKCAGIDLMVEPGGRVERGTPLYRIQSRTEAGLHTAAAQSGEGHGIQIQPG